MKKFKKKDAKKLGRLGRQFYVDLLSGDTSIRWEGVEGRTALHLGRSLLILAKKYGLDLPLSENNAHMILDHLTEVGALVKTRGGAYEPAPDWKSRFTVDVTTTAPATPTSVDDEVEEELVEEKKTPETLRELYREFLTGFKSGSGRKAVIEELRTLTETVTGKSPDQIWIRSRIAFLVRSGLLVEVDSKFLLEDNWEEILKSVKRIDRPITVTTVPDKDRRKETIVTAPVATVRLGLRTADLHFMPTYMVLFDNGTDCVVDIPLDKMECLIGIQHFDIDWAHKALVKAKYSGELEQARDRVKFLESLVTD